MNEQMKNAVMPTTAFQSTGTMVPSGSAFSSMPMLRRHGTATLATTETVESPGGGPRRIAPPKPTGDPTPVGDVLIPLLLMAIIYIIKIKIRKIYA